MAKEQATHIALGENKLGNSWYLSLTGEVEQRRQFLNDVYEDLKANTSLPTHPLL